MPRGGGGGGVSTQAPPQPGRKIAIISRTKVEECYEIKLYLVHADPKEEQCDVDPVLQFRFPYVFFDVPALCFLNSTLYLFEGFHPNPNDDEPPFPENRTKAYKFECSPEGLQLVRLTREKELGMPTSFCPMNPIKNPMNHVKGLPMAIPTPDGKKVLVFSSIFLFKDSGKAFELFNPDNESWETLPALPCIDCRNLPSYKGPRGYRTICVCTDDCCYVVVNSCSFIGKSVFYVELALGAFSMDLEKQEKKWVSLGVPIVPSLECGVRYFGTAMGRYIIIPGELPIYEDEEDGIVYEGEPVYVDKDGRLLPPRLVDPTLCVFDVGEDGFLCPRPEAYYDKYVLEYLVPQVILPLSPFGPPPDARWLKPVPPLITIFPIQEETNTFFVVQQLEGRDLDVDVDEHDCVDEACEACVIRGETRFLIEVCHTDSHHNHTVSKSVSFTTSFSETPGRFFFFAT